MHDERHSKEDESRGVQTGVARNGCRSRGQGRRLHPLEFGDEGTDATAEQDRSFQYRPPERQVRSHEPIAAPERFCGFGADRHRPRARSDLSASGSAGPARLPSRSLRPTSCAPPRSCRLLAIACGLLASALIAEFAARWFRGARVVVRGRPLGAVRAEMPRVGAARTSVLTRHFVPPFKGLNSTESVTSSV